MNVDNTIENKETEAGNGIPSSDHLATILGKACPNDIRRTLAWAHEADATFEIRTRDSRTSPWARISAGYFRDVDAAVKAVLDHVDEFDPAQVYFTLNETIPEVYSRIRDRIEPRPSATTKDSEIQRLRNVLIDFDPVRPQGIPSSEAELEDSRKRMEDVKTWLSDRGFPEPLVGMSGNGYHLLYAIDREPGDDLITGLVHGLADRFDDDAIKIDRKVVNPARLCKLYGTFARKGDDVGDRVNRLSRIVECPERTVVSDQVMRAAVEELQPAPQTRSEPVQSNPRATDSRSRRGGVVNLGRFLANRGIGHRDAGSGKCVLDECVFDPAHNRGEVAVFQNQSGGLAYHCFHDSCSGNHWQQFVERVGKVTKDDFDEPLPAGHRPSCEPPASSPAEGSHRVTIDSPKKILEFPVDVLPDGMREFVREAAEKTRAPLAVVGSAALGVVAAAVQNVAVVTRPGWDEQNLSLFILSILESAAGKSRGMKPVSSAFCTLQANKQQEVQQQKDQNKQVVRALQRECDAMTKGNAAASLLDDIENDVASERLDRLRKCQQKIDELTNPHGGTCLVYDTTPEAMLAQMTATSERVASITGESRFIDMCLGGHYNAAGSPDLLINAFDGETITRRRVGDGSFILGHPALTIVNGIQPARFDAKCMRRPEFADSGLLQRFLMVRPPFAAHESGKQDIDATLQTNWDTRILELADLPVTCTSAGEHSSRTYASPQVLQLAGQADADLRVFESSVVHLQNDVRDTHSPRWGQWLGRVVSQSLRIAGILHAFRHGADFLIHQISVEDVRAAVTLMKYYMSEADRIINASSCNEADANADIVWAYIKDKSLTDFKKRTIRNGLSRRMLGDERTTTGQKITNALGELVDRGWLRKGPNKGGRGETWIVEPGAQERDAS